MAATLTERPAHVPAELVRDFDFYRLPGAETDVLAAWKRLQDESPDIFWTPRYGGHWVVTRADDIERLQADSDTFSYAGHAIPKNLSPNLPLELDPPEHGPIRAIINPLFSPGVIRRLEDLVRARTIELVDGFRGAGRCEFIADFGRQLPIIVFLGLVDLPLGGRQMLLDLAEIRVRGGEPVKREAAKRQLLDYLDAVIRERRENPGSDVLSAIVSARTDGELTPIDTVKNLLSVVMFGGLDTVATMMGFIARFLATHPEERRRLAASTPEQIGKSIDELTRRHGMVTSARTVRRDIEYKGVTLMAGEQVLGPNMLHGLDERRWLDPMKVDLDRPDARANASFGAGPHRCPGANLGKAEIRIFLEEWLKRIPDFDLDPDDPPIMASGLVSAILRLPLVWDIEAEA